MYSGQRLYRIQGNDWSSYTIKPISWFKRVLKTLITYLPCIQNTCEHPTRTNGPIEGINNKIKVLKRNAYGFRNYYHFRNRIILITKMFGPKQKGIKQQLVA